MPVNIDVAMSGFAFFDLKHQPYSCIIAAIEIIKRTQSLRPREELEKAIQDASLIVI